MISPIDFGILEEFYRWISVLLIPVGLILLFYGYRLFKLFLALIGFLFGLGLGMFFGQLLGEPVIIGLLGGILGAALFYVLYKLGIFILGFMSGIIICVLLTFVPTIELHSAVFLISGVLCGIAALFIEKAIIVTISTYQGAALTVSGFAWLLYPEYMNQLYSVAFRDPQLYLSNILIQFLATMILMIIGILYQYRIIPNSLDGYVPRSIRREPRLDIQPKRSVNSSQNFEEIPSPAKEKEVQKIEPIIAVYDEKFLPDKRKSSRIISTPVIKFFKDLHESLISVIGRRKTLFKRSATGLSENTTAAIRYASTSAITKIRTDMSSTKSAIFNFKPGLSNNIEFEQIQIPLHMHILNGHGQGTTIVFYGRYNGSYYSTTIGRETSIEPHHVQLADPEKHVSRYHAEIAMKDKRFYVRNLSNTNVLLLNGIEIGLNEFKPLNSGDVLELAYIKVMLQ